MLRFVLLISTCATVGYFAYPHLNGVIEDVAPTPQVNIILLNSVSSDEIIGSWALSPRSTSLLSSSLGTSGRRRGLSLESWGGGSANFVVGDIHIDGPIAWNAKPGVGKAPATLHIRSKSDEVILKFSKVDDRLVLITDAGVLASGRSDHLRFFKAS